MTIFQPKLVMIDVDGTLVDSVPDLAYCVDQMMLSLDMPVRGEETGWGRAMKSIQWGRSLRML